MFEIILLLVIAGITGGIGRSITGFKSGGCIISIVVGFIGAYIGTILAREFNFPDLWTINIRGIDYPIIWSIIGAVVFTAVLSIIVPKKK
ncbi:MAG: GlsB/YeaQ/YmgE family stress response membrane protein [Ignavibacterium sp.]|jgi:uncharacterized membrane protein YeaQ/YmgE (transglycosylase-associated protein family)|nr:GlsB/YeaQ/YmgE family stress response membrane protein [Ignavibacterium sp.]